jgi:hypothetical protein
VDLQFVVDAHSWKSKAGALPIYKVSLKNSDGHILSIVSNDRSIFEIFPKGEAVDVKIGKAQRALNEFPEDK